MSTFPFCLSVSTMFVKPALVKRGVNSYQKNRVLIDIVHIKDQVNTQTKQKLELCCSTHPDKMVNIVCMTCADGLCSKCVVNMMRCKQHDGHELDDINEAFDKTKMYINNIRSLIETINVRIRQCTINKLRIQNEAEESKKIVKKAAEDAIAYIHQQQQQL